MKVDHASSIFDEAHLHGDTSRGWVPGTALPEGEFLTRWVTHLCAPVFVLLAGPCAWHRRDKAAHPDGWTRYV